MTKNTIFKGQWALVLFLSIAGCSKSQMDLPAGVNKNINVPTAPTTNNTTAPIISFIQPQQLTATQGGRIEIYGDRFQAGATVTLRQSGNNIPCDNVGFTSKNKIACDAPAAQVGMVDIQVKNADGSSIILSSALEYIQNGNGNQAPTVFLQSSASSAQVNQIVTLSGIATDSDGTVQSTVQLMKDGAQLSDLNLDAGGHFSYDFSTATAGTYTFVVRATDDQGASGDSNSVVVQIGGGTPTTLNPVIDASKGTNGVGQIPDLVAAQRDYWFNAVQALGSGKILVAGAARSTRASADYDMLVARFNSNGTLDLTFANGKGYLLIDFTTCTGDSGTSSCFDEATSIRVIESNVVLAKTTTKSMTLTTSTGPWVTSTTGPWITTTTGWITTTTTLPTPPTVHDAIILSGSTRVGEKDENGDGRTAVAMITPDGALDTTFGAGGKKAFGGRMLNGSEFKRDYRGRGLAVTQSRIIAASGESCDSGYYCKFASGNMDFAGGTLTRQSYDTLGKATINQYGNGGVAELMDAASSSMILQNKNGQNYLIYAGTIKETMTNSTGDAALMRVKVSSSQLTADTTFGSTVEPGLFMFSMQGSGSSSQMGAKQNVGEGINDIALDSSGRILLSGTASVNNQPQLFIGRMDSDAKAFDTTFGASTQGQFKGALLGLNSSRDKAVLALTAQSSGAVYGVGYFRRADATGNGTQMLVLKLNSSGALDTSFAGQGFTTIDFDGATKDTFQIAKAATWVSSGSRLAVAGQRQVNGKTQGVLLFVIP